MLLTNIAQYINCTRCHASTVAVCALCTIVCNIQEYLKATGTFNLEEAFPNLESHPYHWRVDPYETNRYRCQQQSQAVTFSVHRPMRLHFPPPAGTTTATDS